MASQWFKNAVVYCIDVDTFKDGNGDGIGDFIGLRQGLSYLAGLGVSCIWLLPFFVRGRRFQGDQGQGFGDGAAWLRLRLGTTAAKSGEVSIELRGDGFGFLVSRRQSHQERNEVLLKRP
jgi:Alpha amylase, catalytic domain